MDELAVKQWLVDRLDVSRETLGALDRFVALLLAEARQQNLISRATIEDVWSRHILDSAQLLLLAREYGAGDGDWLDLGSGPGLPGIVLALAGNMSITLVEERARRAAFLEQAVRALGLDDRVTVEGKKVQRVENRGYSVITARAFAPLPKLFDLAYRFARPGSLWILPKGKSVEEELAAVRGAWQGRFETVQSVTDSESFILLAQDVKPERRR
ncbi:16S rRNA (guanine(527)-N(7))-methyltransferase RsmG [Parasphingopyxis sp. GrpM-11]|uniref:Ribosomal RNA small subunit methyltransferase G n=2 Tax=Parasphingopyxis marina TaxID=2761622 RepID=A0A842HXR4_9SPHN|nr:16S rRNA (guanine(527)-N(7))-methyltransferase RsmG [Parasphingopyxis marina]